MKTKRHASESIPFVTPALRSDMKKRAVFRLQSERQSHCERYTRVYVRLFTLFLTRDNRVLFAPDGGRQYDPIPLYGLETWEDAHRYLSQLTMAPNVEYIQPTPDYPKGRLKLVIVPASDADSGKTWALTDEAEDALVYEEDDRY